MDNTPQFPPSSDDSAGQPRRSPWVYIGAVAGLVALLVVLHLTGVVGAS